MTQVTLDANVASKLQEICHEVELIDPSGRVLGNYTPRINLTEWELVGPELSEEELTRREQETETYSTAEVLAYLEQPSCSESDGKKPH